MAYYLRHHFDPDFDYTHLKPRQDDTGNIDRYNLGYVQNVIRGQVLAELVPLEDAGVDEPDPRFVLEEPELPVGPNCTMDAHHPNLVLADANGYVFYNDGLITVKRMLNVRHDVDFHTGNIFFVGDVAVHGDLRAGFEVQGNNVLIKGIIEGGVVRSRGSLVVEGGARGGAGRHCKLDAGDTLRIAFAEGAELRAHGNMLVERFCVHSTIYAASNLVVRGRLHGGTVHSNGLVYAEQCVGNDKGTQTRINLGYDPYSVRKLERFEQRIRELTERITHYEAVAGHMDPDASDTARRLAAARKKLQRLIAQRKALWHSLSQDEANAARCRLVVPGKIYPGVEIAIGRAFHLVEREASNVCFVLEDEEIVMHSPAITAKKRPRS